MWSGADASYLAAITAAAREYTWHGTLTDADGTSYSFDASDIVAGSGQISRVVSSAASLDIGTVYASELSIRLFLSVDRYKLYDGTITLYCDVDVSGTTYSVPMGVYTISECTQELSCIAITAYDAMTKFDDVTVTIDQGTVTPYNWISYIAGLAGVTLGTSEADINAMPNGTTALTYTYCDTKLSEMSGRDALAYLCGAICANAYIGRDGLLYIQQYGMTADDDIAANERFSSSLSDFTTNYTGISLKIYATGTTEYYAEATDDGLTVEMGANPWLQNGTTDERETACMAIIDSLTTVSYVPYTVTMPIRPEFDPMDVLTFSGNQASSDIGAITAITYKMGGSMTIKCTGANPRLADAKSKTEKSLAALTSTVAQEVNQMSVVQNATAVTIAESTETSILSYAFEVTSETNTTMIDVSVALTASAVESESDDVYTLSDIVAALSFYVDDSEVTVYDPQFIIDEGKDTMTFNYSLSGLSTGAHEFDVRLTMDGGTGSIAAGDVHEMLWGYGITFEVYISSIEITALPDTTTFYLGETTDYTGVEVTANYNNGLTSDVTSSCTYSPASGTAVTEDGTLTVTCRYYDSTEKKTFSTTFDLTASTLFEVLRDNDSFLWSATGNTKNPTLRLINDVIYAIYTKTSSTSSTITKSYSVCRLSMGDDMCLDTDDSNSGGSVTYSTTYRASGFNDFLVGAVYYIYPAYYYNSSTDGFDVPYSIDMSTGTTTEMTATYTMLEDESYTVTRFHPSAYSSEYYGFYCDGMIIFPRVNLAYDNNGTTSTKTAAAYAIVSGSVMNFYILESTTTPAGTLISTIRKRLLFGSENYKTANYSYIISDGSVMFYSVTADTTNILTETEIATFTTNLTTFTSYRKVWGKDVYIFYSSSDALIGIWDVNAGTFVEASSSDLTDLIYYDVTWSDSQQAYFYMYTTDDGARQHYLYFSTDLVNWRNTYGYSTVNSMNLAANLLPYDEYLIAGGFNGSSSYYLSTIHFLTDL